MSVATLVLLAVSTIPLRNPFWPVGFAGEREAISDKPRVVAKPAPEPVPEEDTKTSVTAEAIAAAAEADVSESQYEDRLWIAARKSLVLGATLRTGDRQAITINGNVYADGDLISANHNGRRFTWRVKYLSDRRTLKLQRIRSRILEEDPPAGKEKKK